MSLTCLIQPDFDAHNITNVPPSVRSTWYLLSVINGLAAPPTVVLNLFIICTVLGDKRLRSVNYNLLLSTMAVTDFLVGILVQPLFCWYLGCLLQDDCHSYCPYTIYTASILICCGLTLSTFTMASIERYLAIEHPFFYQLNISRRRFMTAIAMVWILTPAALLTGRILTNNLQENLRKVQTIVIVSVNFAPIVFCNIKVHVTSYRKRKAIATQAESVKQQSQALEFKRVVIVWILLIETFLFCCPTIIMILIEIVAGRDVTDDFKYVSHPIYVTFAHLQSLVNPITISLRLSCIRKELKKKVNIVKA